MIAARRWPALLLIIGLLTAAFVYERGDHTDGVATTATGALADDSLTGSSDLARAMPVAAPPGALSSTWFCAGGTATPDGVADHVVVVANPGARVVRGTVTAMGSRGGPAERAITVPAHGRARVALSDLVEAPYASALVELGAGAVAVEHEVQGPDGRDAAPCASSASDRWYFAAGATTRDAEEVLVLFNPFADDATVDISFATDEGRRVPQAFQGFQVPGRSVVAARVTDQVTVRAQVSTEVVARVGRVVVDRIQTYDGSGASTTEEAAAEEAYRPQGLTVTLGVPRPSPTWLFPFGAKEDGVHERFVIYNPGTEEVEVDVAVRLVDPARNGELDPFLVTIAARSFQVLDLDDEDRVPPDVDHATVVTSRRGEPIVVERLLATEDPFASTGTAASTGVPLVAPRWVFASGSSRRRRVAERIAVQNPSGRPVRVRVEAFATGDGSLEPIEGLSPVTIGPYGHVQLRLSSASAAPNLSVLVSADGPVAAERADFRVDTTGVSTAPGIPLAEGLRRAEPSALGP